MTGRNSIGVLVVLIKLIIKIIFYCRWTWQVGKLWRSSRGPLNTAEVDTGERGGGGKVGYLWISISI